jgi:hypothetical protein
MSEKLDSEDLEPLSPGQREVGLVFIYESLAAGLERFDDSRHGRVGVGGPEPNGNRGVD